MRDALITLAGALLSLIVLVSLMSPAQDRLLLSRPTTEDRGNHGLAAAYRWLAGNNISTHSLRRPFSRIEQAALPGSGNLLIVSLPALRQVLESEWVALNSWIGSGNSVLVLSAMYHLPQWNHSVELTRRQAIMDSIAKLTADEFSLQNDDIDLPETIFVLSDLRDSVRAFKPAPYTLYPTTRHPLFEGVGELQSWHTPGLYRYHGQSAETKSVYWTLDSDSSRLSLTLMHGESPQQTGMWLLPVGEGWIYFSAFSDLLSNSVLKQHDNARWFSNLLAHALAEGGYVIFDDYHFGLSDLYDPFLCRSASPQQPGLCRRVLVDLRARQKPATRTGQATSLRARQHRFCRRDGRFFRPSNPVADDCKIPCRATARADFRAYPTRRQFALALAG